MIFNFKKYWNLTQNTDQNIPFNKLELYISYKQQTKLI